MTQTNPVVSFVIRTKNEEKYLDKVLRYIFSQTYKNIEVIIVDSGSTDNTIKIAQKYPTKVFKIKQKDFSYSYSLNLGTSKARGKYICIISGHSIPITDRWLEDGLKNFKDKKVAGVTGVCINSNPLGYLSRDFGYLTSWFFISKYKKKNIPFLTNTNAIIRKDLWKTYPFDESLYQCEDFDWGTEMISRGYKILKDYKFSVFHSHIFLNKPKYLSRWLGWRKTEKEIKNKNRPSKSFSKLSSN